MLGFGVVGYVFKKLDYPLAPLVLALVLGNNAENSFRQSMLMSQGEHDDHVVERAGRQHHDAVAGMLFWPLISKLRTTVFPARPNPLAEQRPVE